MTVEFLLTSLIIVATPGTGVLYTVAAGLTRGARASIVAAVGCTLGIIPHMAAAITGLAALLHTSAVAFGVLKYLGVAYLLYLAWSTLKDKGALAVEEEDAPKSARKMITTGILINILNPKLTAFFFAFLPLFVNSGDPQSLLRMLQLSAVFMLLTFVIFGAYGVFAAAVREQVLTRPRVLAWMRRVFAGSFVALSAKLAFTRQ
ncbi:MAG: LysE family translocator [Acidobacteria bacterium]|nr:LysE family translocator [Acidobacteriota bacterium]